MRRPISAASGSPAAAPSLRNVGAAVYWLYDRLVPQQVEDSGKAQAPLYMSPREFGSTPLRQKIKVRMLRQSRSQLGKASRRARK